MKRIALIALATVALTGCKTQIATDLFTSDLIAATEGETLTAPLVIGIDTSSESQCKENAPALTDAIKSQFPGADFIGCEKDAFDVFARFRVQAAIIPMTDVTPTPDAPFAVGVKADASGFIVAYLTNPQAVRAVWDALPEEMTQYKKFELDPALSAVLTNDLRGKVTITTDDVFADGVPVQGTVSRSMTRRDQVEITMSDVTNAAFGNVANISHIVSFARAD